ncbi:hypothetical protein SDC9_191437 [bioreactor metagenome]|uniref:Uncharacterized protein n=1 Tax=bioreactor metagenome TaxID=1076179 RepID=A0A645HZ60_9ZZZZ
MADQIDFFSSLQPLAQPLGGRPQRIGDQVAHRTGGEQWGELAAQLQVIGAVHVHQDARPEHGSPQVAG